MRTTQILPNLRVADVEATKSFYSNYLGLSTEEFNMGWVARCSSRATQPHPKMRSSPFSRMTSKVLMQKLSNSATRLCTR